METRDREEAMRAFLHFLKGKMSPLRTYFDFVDDKSFPASSREALVRNARKCLDMIDGEMALLGGILEKARNP